MHLRQEVSKGQNRETLDDARRRLGRARLEIVGLSLFI